MSSFRLVDAITVLTGLTYPVLGMSAWPEKEGDPFAGDLIL
jgi:hypothetical protein